MQTAKHTFTGAFWGAAGGIVNFEIGNIENLLARIAVHSVSEGTIEGIRGAYANVKNAIIYQTGFSHGVSGHLDVVYRRKAAQEIYDAPTFLYR